MEHSHFHKLSKLLWGAIVTLVVVLAIYVSFGRMLMSNVEQYDVEILRELNARLPFLVEADKVSGEWHFFSPEVVLSGLKLKVAGSTDLPIELNEGRVTLDVLESLRTRSLQISKLLLDALSLQGELSEEGRFSLVGFGQGNKQVGDWLEQFLLNIESVELSNNRLAVSLPNNQLRQLQLDLVLRRHGSNRLLEAKVFSQTSGTLISAVAEGFGNPMDADNFVGELYLNIAMDDLSAFQELVKRPAAVNIKGGLYAELWLGWDRGEPSVVFDLQGQGLDITALDKSWQLPAERISMQASLVERNDHWTVFVSDFEFQKDNVLLLLSRLQMDIWGDSFRLRADAVPLAPLNALLVDLSLTPDAIADVFEVLNTRGEMSALQLDVADAGAPLDDWQLSANFENLEVDSWRGAPGVTSVKGYVELSRAGGYVILDSQSFAMDFPTVYEQPLFYDDVFGTINIDWDDEELKLSSGLLSVSGGEGLAHLLFGLNVPLVKNAVGLEMDLLVGLENFDPRYRSKYLPYILSDALLGWLEPSIGEGQIEQGAFLWRGNLRLNTPALKTIQLFFNVADTQLNYHPDWPPVSGVDGIVLIDDTDVSVWSQKGRLYNSEVSYLSAEAWMDENKRMVLAIGGSLNGPAEDGLEIVNHSPITDIVGPVFVDWEVRGQLQTELQLQMVLSGAPEPADIDVKTRWQEIDLQINPGNLSVSNISGFFSYDSARGFGSQGLKGELWGRPLEAQVSQNESSGVEVALSSRIDMADVQRWLDLDTLAFARGETQADVRIIVVPEEGATLLVDSDLQGVALDLPMPWRKLPELAVPLHVKFPLGSSAAELELNLLSGLQLHMQLSEGAFTGGALSFYESPGHIETSVLRITGHMPLLDVGQWQDFITEYITDDLLASMDAGGGMSVEVDKLGADTVFMMEQDVRDVVLSLESSDGAWKLFAETDWVSGTLRPGVAGEKTRLDVRSLDLGMLSRLNLASGNDDEPLEFPDMTVSLMGLYRGDQSLGELNFDLENAGDTLLVSNIVGNIAGLEIDAATPASLRWLRRQEESSTQLEAVFNLADFGTTLEKLGYQKILETENGHFDVVLEWPGSPQSISLNGAQGSVSIAVGEGRFLSAPAGASGALRVISVLNLAEIISRLSLSHMFESGIPFHAVDGEVFLSEGSIEVANMEVEGSTSGFQFSGVADVLSKSLEGNLVVTLPVASNLPWIVALTAGLPVAAGVYVVSKVFEKQMNRFTSGVYRVSGPWDDPQVDFVRIFDDTSAADVKPESPASGELPTDPNTPEIDPNAPPVDPNMPPIDLEASPVDPNA